MEASENTSLDQDEDLTEKLGEDITIHVFDCLDTPRDLASAACVSHLWYRFVFRGSLWKKMCIKCFPELQKFRCILDCSPKKRVIDLDGSRQLASFPDVQEVSRAYQNLLRELQAPPLAKTCIMEPLHASSTDNLPHESIFQTLLPMYVFSDEMTPSYWSSSGQINPGVPETLTYRLVSDLCVIHEVKIQPFKAFFQPGNPVYSAASVCFRFGYTRSPLPLGNGLLDNLLSERPLRVNNDDYVWTYESPTFLMTQEDTLQSFKLPKPVICIGGIFQVELMGRVQTQSTDNLYYICVAHIHVEGRPIVGFKYEGQDKSGDAILKYTASKDNFLSQALLFYSALTSLQRDRVGQISPRTRSYLAIVLQNFVNAGLVSHEWNEIVNS